MERLIALVLLVCVVIMVLAWIGNEVGGGGFWFNIQHLVIGVARLAVLIAGILTVVYLALVLITGEWSVIW